MTDEVKTDIEVKPVSPLDEAKAVLEEIKKEKADLIALRTQQANNLIGGIADAGQAPVQPKVETAKEYAEGVMSGRIKAK